MDENLRSRNAFLMKANLKKITIALETRVVRWARAEAARKQISVSRMLEELLKERMPKEDDYEAAMRRALTRKPFPISKVRTMSREDAHERTRLG